MKTAIFRVENKLWKTEKRLFLFDFVCFLEFSGAFCLAEDGFLVYRKRLKAK